jgi:hypothetical protein
MPMVAQTLIELPTLPIWFFAQTAKGLWSIFCDELEAKLE